MKVGYVVNQYPKVTHTFVRTEIAAVERAGVAVERIAIRRADSALLDPLDQQEATRTHVLLDTGFAGLLGALLHAAATRPGALLRALRMTVRIGWRSPRGLVVHVAYLAEACVLLRRVVELGIDHLHAAFGSNPAAVALLCRMLGGPPYSFTAHGPEEFDHADQLAIAEKVAHAAFVTVVSEAGRAHLQHHCRLETWARMHLVRCGVDARFSRHLPTPVPAARRLVYVGRMCAEKAPLVLVEAVARLIAAGEDCQLVMLGDGPLRAAVAARVGALGLTRQVQLLGWASGEEVLRQILAARALVLASFAEGLPVVLMEALALARPVICTPVGGVAELVEPGVSGWIVPAGSVGMLAEAMRMALNAEPAELEQMGRNGAARLARQHDPDVAGSRLATLFAGGAPAAV